MTVAFDEMARREMKNMWWQDDFKWDGTPVSQMVVREVPTKLARRYIASFHYSHTMPDSTRFAYAGYLNGRLCGIICYGMGCGKNQYTALIPEIENGTYLELTRLWCADSYPRNTESKLISESLRMLPREIKLILSFADQHQGHCGIIYQATNWYYLGQTDGGEVLLTENGVKKHQRLLGIYRMRHPEYREYTAEELMKLLGYTTIAGGKKYRYAYLRGSRKEKKELLEQIKDKIQSYPKQEKKKDTMNELEMITELSEEAKEGTQIGLWEVMNHG